MAAEEVLVNVHDHGKIVDTQKHRVQCNYCDKEMSGTTRLKYHLGGVRGDVTACLKVPENVKELFRNMLETRKGTPGKEVKGLFQQDLTRKRNRCPNSNGFKKSKCGAAQTSNFASGNSTETDSVSEDGMNEPIVLHSRRAVSQTAVNADQNEDSSSRQAKKCIARFFYETGIDFSAANSSSLQRMINSTIGCSQTKYGIPSSQELKGWILQDEVKEMQEYVKNIRQSWTRTGCSILLDGWVDEKGRNLVSFIVDCPQGPIYLWSSDVSAHVDNIDALHLLLDGVIKEVGVENVVQIVAFSTTGWVGALGKQFMDRNRTVFWTLNASHCIELILEKIAMMDKIRETLSKAKIISKFIHGHPTVLKLLRDFTGTHYLIKPCKLRSVMPFLTLENMISEKKSLSVMFASSKWKTSIWASRTKGKRVADLVGDSTFWKGAGMVIKATLPLVRVLCLINGADKPQMGYIYETMDQVKETIKEEFKGKESQYMPIWEVIDEIWDGQLHSALHAAGYYLNPSLFYSTDFHSDPEVAFGLLCCMVRLVLEQRVQDLISRQLEEYRNSRGAFSEGSTAKQSSKVSPASWWSLYGGQYPELQQFATRILSQTCAGASKYRLNRSLAEKLLTNGRNPLEQQVLSDLAFIHYNLQLQQQHSELGGSYEILAEDIDPMDDWIVDDTEEEAIINGERSSQFEAKEEPK
ncbi:hypothetical protein SLE2022_380170 [Rubroshorea leprosula]